MRENSTAMYLETCRSSTRDEWLQKLSPTFLTDVMTKHLPFAPWVYIIPLCPCFEISQPLLPFLPQVFFLWPLPNMQHPDLSTDVLLHSIMSSKVIEFMLTRNLQKPCLNTSEKQGCQAAAEGLVLVPGAAVHSLPWCTLVSPGEFYKVQCPGHNPHSMNQNLCRWDPVISIFAKIPVSSQVGEQLQAADHWYKLAFSSGNDRNSSYAVLSMKDHGFASLGGSTVH